MGRDGSCGLEFGISLSPGLYGSGKSQPFRLWLDRFSEGRPQQGEHGALPYFRRAPTPARRMRDCSDTHGEDPADLLKVKSTKAWGPGD